MAEPTFKAPKGTRDILPPESGRRRALIDAFAQQAELAGFGEIMSPIFEDLGVDDEEDVQNLRDDLARDLRAALENAGAKRGHLNNIESAVIAKRANAAPRHLALLVCLGHLLLQRELRPWLRHRHRGRRRRRRRRQRRRRSRRRRGGK